MSVKVIAGVAGAVILIVALVAAALFYFRYSLIPTSEPENTASYYPSDTLIYAWFTLTPGDGQLKDMVNIWKSYEDFGILENFQDDLFEDFEVATKIDVEDGIVPWIGADMSVALLDIDVPEDESHIVATIGVRDSEAADSFMDKWLDYFESEGGSEFDSDTEGDFDIWEDDNEIYALSDDLLMFATDRNALDDVLERIADDSKDTLADSEDFREARNALASRRFASMYISIEEIMDRLDDVQELDGIRELVDLRWTASSLGWVDKGVVMESVTPASSESVWPAAPEMSDPSQLLSDDTLGLLSISFDPVLDHYREMLDEYELDENIASLAYDLDSEGRLGSDSTMADLLDVGLDYIGDIIGIDLEDDLLNHLDGQFTISVKKFDFDDAIDYPEDNAVDAAMMLSYRNDSGEDLQKSLDDLTQELSELAGEEIDRRDIGAERDARLLAIEGTDYEVGFVLHDGQLIFASTRDMLESTVKAQKGDGANLSSDAKFQRVTSYLPEKRQLMGYMDLVKTVENIDPRDIGWTRAEYRMLESLSAVAFSYATEDGYSRMTVALTLFPEE